MIEFNYINCDIITKNRRQKMKKNLFLSMILAIMFLSVSAFAGNKPGYMTSDQKDALDGANSPSSSNVLATADDITAADTGVQTAGAGVNMSNSGDTDNPIFDLDISENVDMDTNQLINLKVPSADGMAIRQTSKITEVKLEDADDKKHTQGTDQKLDDGGGNEVTAAELRTHLDNLTKHREIDDSSTADTKLWSASKINTELYWVDEVPLPFRMTWDDGDTYLQHFQIRVGEGNCADTGVYVVDKESKDAQADWTYFSPNNVIQIPAEGVDYLHNHLIVQYTTGQSVLSKNVMYNIWKRVYNATDSVYGDWDWLGSIIK